MIQATIRKMHDAQRNVVMQFTGVSDGVGPDEVAAVKVDVQTMLPIPQRVCIRRIEGMVDGGLLRLMWDLPGDPITMLDLTGYVSLDYTKTGGINDAGGLNTTGNVLFSTLGFDVGSSYSLRIEMVKKYG